MIWSHPSLVKYLNDVSLHKRLTRVEEKTAGPEDLVKANLRLVIYAAMRWAKTDEDMLDRIQDGNVGLLIAAQRFDPTYGVNFSTYAMHWITNAMREGVIKSTRIVQISRRAYHHYAQALKLKEQGVNYTEIAATLELHIEEVKSLFDYGDDALDDEVLYLTSPDEVDVDLVHVLSKATRVLNPTEQQQLTHLLHGHNRSDFAREKGHSPEWARQLELKILAKLQSSEVKK